MKKFISGLVILLVLLTLLGGIFFILDKNEYYTKAKTKFTIDEDLGEGLTRRIGLGYVFYTREAVEVKSENSHLIRTWFNMVSREKALELLGSDIEVMENLPGLDAAETQIVMYYTALLTEALNEEENHFDLDNMENIYIDLDNFRNLKNDEELDSKVKDYIIEKLDEFLENPKINIENKKKSEVINELKKVSEEIKDGIHVSLNIIKDSKELELILHKEISNTVELKYKYNEELLENNEFKIFEKI